jgi:XTP/dITP diphosphohydrolase
VNAPLRLVLASGNPHKAAEMRALAADSRLPLEFLSATAFGGMPPVVEDTGTFSGNARRKARALLDRLPAGHWSLADDSGLCVDALAGAPGVESAYYAGPAGDAAANLAKLVTAMTDVPPARRGAHFVCVLCLLDPSGRESLFEGRCAGRLAAAPDGGGGFGYDPLFIPEGQTATLARLGDAAKNALSHRARAWSALAAAFRHGMLGPA